MLKSQRRRSNKSHIDLFDLRRCDLCCFMCISMVYVVLLVFVLLCKARSIVSNIAPKRVLIAEQERQECIKITAGEAGMH